MNFRKFVIQALKFLGFLAAGILLLWLAFRKVDIRSLTSDLKEAKYLWLILSLLFGMIAFILRARRWQLLIHPLKFRPSFWNTFNALMIGYVANLALPRIGEITRCVTLGRKEKIAVDKLIGTVIVERTIDFLSVIIFLVLILFTSGTIIRNFLNESIFLPIKVKVIELFGVSWLFWIILALIGITGLYLLYRFRKNLSSIRFFSKIFDVARGVVSGLKTIKYLERKWEFIINTVLIWISYAFMTWVVVFCLESTSDITFWESLIILVVGGLAMSVPVQAGFGAYHYAISRLLIVLNGVSLEDGLTYALLAHESQIIFEIFIGLFSVYFMFRKSPKASTNELP